MESRGGRLRLTRRPAAPQYTQAIELAPGNAPYYTNRSMCYYKQQNFAAAAADGIKAAEVDAGFAKGWLRAAQACRHEIGCSAQDLCGPI